MNMECVEGKLEYIRCCNSVTKHLLKREKKLFVDGTLLSDILIFLLSGIVDTVLGLMETKCFLFVF